MVVMNTECVQCGLCEREYDCVFLPNELLKLRYFAKSKIIFDRGYYFLNTCEYYVGGKCAMHSDRRPLLCIIYPIRLGENGALSVDTNCPAHNTVTSEDVNYAQSMLAVLSKERLRQIFEVINTHNS